MISEEAKSVIENSPFIALVTIDPDGTPHPIILGKGEVQDDNVVFGVYKMEKTQRNIAQNSNTWFVAAVKDDGPKGYRFSGTAAFEDKKLIFKVSTVEELL